MREQKLLQRKRKAECAGNRSELASVCIDLAELYVSQEKHLDAIDEYITVADIYQRMGKSMDYGRVNRGIGEAYVHLKDFDMALKYHTIYLEIARKEKNKVEEQRAHATIGHTYLTKYDQTDSPNQNDLNLAFKSFTKSLTICESLTGLKKYEHKDMKARLLANLGLVQECKGDYDTAIDLLEQSIVICKNHDLYEQLHRGYYCMGKLYTHKKEYDEAILQYNLAYEVAERLKNKIPLMCDSLSAKADILIIRADVQGAKWILLKAHKLRHPDLIKSKAIEQKLKIVVAMCDAKNSLLTTENDDFITKKKLYEKLGDGACSLQNLSYAIECYQRMLESARNNRESGVELSPCYISLAETYRDDQQFEMAIKYYRKDFNILRNDHKEGIITLFSIADCMEASNCSLNEIEGTFSEAIRMCKAAADEELEHKALTNYVAVLKKHAESHKVAQLEQRIKQLRHIVIHSDTDSQTTPNIGDNVSLDDLTDMSEEIKDESRTSRRRTKTVVGKRNCKGETQLHTACINGTVELVRRLLDQGHPVNTRDNAGWLPIHEACSWGHYEIVQILIEKGAAINDRGGTMCQGLTPLHDAASNGHLEVLELLLNKGASSIAQDDNGVIPLQLLQTWGALQEFNHEEQTLYDSLVKRLTQDADKLGLSKRLSNRTDSSALILEEELDEISPKRRQVRSGKIGSLRRNLSFDKDLERTSIKHSFSERSQGGKDEYRRVMENLRHPTRDETMDKKRKSQENSQKSAYVEDVNGDDWLEDDVPSTSSGKKRKTGSGDGFMNTLTVREKATSSTRLRRHNSFSSVKSSASYGDDEKRSDISDSDFMIARGLTNVDNFAHVNRATQSKRMKKKQTSLIDNGFTRRYSISSSNSSHSGSPQKKNNYGSTDDLSSYNVNINNIFNTEPTLSVDVGISGKLYKVPVPACEIQTRTIKWLADEAAKRYCRKECMKPSLELATKNGAILADDDFISVLFSAGHSEEVEARIVKLNLLPLAERYAEACAVDNIDPPKELVKILEEVSVSLVLADLNLRDMNIAPLCKVLSRQINLYSLNLSGNFIHDDCFQLLCLSLQTLDNLTDLNLSLNQLTSVGMQYLTDAFTQSTKPTLSNLVKLDLSHNPLGNESLNYLSIVTRHVNLKSLNLRDVDFTKTIFDLDTNICGDLNLDFILNFDISYNQLGNDQIITFLSWLKPQSMETLNISSNTEVTEGLLKNVVNWLETRGDANLNLRLLNLSRTCATDGEVFEFIRHLAATKFFQSLDLSYNSNLTGLSLRRLIETRPSLNYLNLTGCANIFKYFQDCTVNTWTSIQLKELKLSSDFNEYLAEKNSIVTTWKGVYKHQARTKELQNFVQLSIIE